MNFSAHSRMSLFSVYLSDELGSLAEYVFFHESPSHSPTPMFLFIFDKYNKLCVLMSRSDYEIQSLHFQARTKITKGLFFITPRQIIVISDYIE